MYAHKVLYPRVGSTGNDLLCKRRPDAGNCLDLILGLHPQDPDRIISVVASTRYRLEQEPLSADALASSFVGAMQFGE